MDIKVITIWECEIKDCFQYRMESLLEEIKEKDENKSGELRNEKITLSNCLLGYWCS